MVLPHVVHIEAKMPRTERMFSFSILCCVCHCYLCLIMNCCFFASHFALNVLSSSFFNPQFHLPCYSIFYLFFISKKLSMAYLIAKTRQMCDHCVNIGLYWTPPVNMNIKVIANINIRNGPLDWKTRLSYINFRHCLQWIRKNQLWGSLSTQSKLHLILMNL